MTGYVFTAQGAATQLPDNEALSQDYEIATLADILRDHVTPYGISVGELTSMAPVSQFSVAAGSSEWSVLYDFARYYNGIYPRFDQLGRLILSPWDNSAEVVLDSTVPVMRLVCRDRRYGVLSQVVVRDRYQNWTETVNNTSFQALGGQRRQVLTMPGKSQYQAMRYSGQYQLEQSAAEQLRLKVEVPKLFFAKPGDLVRLQQPNWGRNGQYRVAEAQVARMRMGRGASWSWRPRIWFCEVTEMWTANRKREGRTEECSADQGTVTLGGDPAAVYLGGERRWVSLYVPGGYQWRPKAGDQRELPCLVGKRPDEGTGEDEFPPGSVRIHSGTGVVLLDEDGLTLKGDAVALKGAITVNGQGLEVYIQNIVSQVLASLLG